MTQERPDFLATAPGNSFIFASDRLKQWTTATDSWVYGFWCRDWADEYLPLHRNGKCRRWNRHDHAARSVTPLPAMRGPVGTPGLIAKPGANLGHDLFARAASWSEAVFHQAVCAAAVNILTISYTRELEEMNPQDARNLLLGWVLRIALYFQDGVMEFDFDRLFAYWQREYPHALMVRWQGSLEDPDYRFVLLRAFTGILSAAMMPMA